jgi:filamentous hemagglutinin
MPLQEFNAVLRSIRQQKILAQQEQRLGELVQAFKPGSNINELTLAGERVMLQNTNSVGTTKLFNTSGLSDAELQKRVFEYAGELTGGQALKLVDKGVWTAKLDDGTIINARSVSTSDIGRWTIEIVSKEKIFTMLGRPRIEVKFKSATYPQRNFMKFYSLKYLREIYSIFGWRLNMTKMEKMSKNLLNFLIAEIFFYFFWSIFFAMVALSYTKIALL